MSMLTVALGALAVGVLLNLVVLLRVRLARAAGRGEARVALVWRVGGPALALLGAAGVAVSVLSGLQEQERRAQFWDLQQANVAVIAVRGATRLTVDQIESQRFFRLVAHSPRAAGGGTPAGPGLLLELGPVTYSLAPDAQRPGVVWLRQEAPAATLGSAALWELQSPELQAWLAALEPRLR